MPYLKNATCDTERGAAEDMFTSVVSSANPSVDSGSRWICLLTWLSLFSSCFLFPPAAKYPQKTKEELMLWLSQYLSWRVWWTSGKVDSLQIWRLKFKTWYQQNNAWGLMFGRDFCMWRSEIFLTSIICSQGRERPLDSSLLLRHNIIYATTKILSRGSKYTRHYWQKWTPNIFSFEMGDVKTCIEFNSTGEDRKDINLPVKNEAIIPDIKMTRESM